MTIYSLLEKYAKDKKRFEKTEEFRFFIAHRDILIKYAKFADFYELSDNDFNVFRANVLIYGHLNKVLFEKEIESLDKYMKASKSKKMDKNNFLITLKERMVDSPYFAEEKNKIYIPFYSRPINLIYLKEPWKLLEYPYSGLKDSTSESLIDPFDTYGAELYNSYFTKLVKVATNGKEIAYFHYDTNCIYVVNSQGRLDVKITLFDKYMKKISSNHMLDRLKPVMDAYFQDDREAFINALLENNLISNKMLYLIKKNSYQKK